VRGGPRGGWGAGGGRRRDGGQHDANGRRSARECTRTLPPCRLGVSRASADRALSSRQRNRYPGASARSYRRVGEERSAVPCRAARLPPPVNGTPFSISLFSIRSPPPLPPPSSGLPPTAHRGARAAPRRVFLKGTQGRLSSAGSGSDKRGHAAPRASIAVAWGRRMLDAQVSIGTLLPCRFFKSCASMPSLS